MSEVPGRGGGRYSLGLLTPSPKGGRVSTQSHPYLLSDRWKQGGLDGADNVAGRPSLPWLPFVQPLLCHGGGGSMSHAVGPTVQLRFLHKPSDGSLGSQMKY